LRAALTWARVSFRARPGSGTLASSSRTSGASRFSKASRAAGRLPQLVPQPLHLPGAFPDHRLVRAGQHLGPSASGLSPATSRSWRSQCGPCPRARARHRRRSSRRTPRAGPGTEPTAAGYGVYPVARSQQRHHPRAAVGLDPDLYLRAVGVLTRKPPIRPCSWAIPVTPSRQLPLGEHLPRLVHHLDVVMVLGPVIAHGQPLPHARQHCRKLRAARWRTICDLIKTVLTPSAGTTSQQRSILPAADRGTVFAKGSKPRETKCSPCRQPPHSESAVSRTRQLLLARRSPSSRPGSRLAPDCLEIRTGDCSPDRSPGTQAPPGDPGPARSSATPTSSWMGP
jgi:hypothetical protein